MVGDAIVELRQRLPDLRHRLPGGVDDLDRVPPHHRHVADAGAVRLKERHYVFGDEKIESALPVI